MNIAIDLSPLKSGNFLQHRVRGTGFYLQNLKRTLEKYYPQNKYTFFTRGEKLLKNVDLVHYPYFEPFFLTLPFFKKYRTVVTVHDLTPLVFPKFFKVGVKGLLKWQLQKKALRNADAVIADSQCSKRDIVKFTRINDRKVHVVYLAASEIFKPIKDTMILRRIIVKYKLPKKFALYVGDVTWNKNLPALVEAIRAAKIPLVLVGKAIAEKEFDRTNPWNQDLIKVKKLAEENKNIFILGFVSNEDLVGLYNAATVFVMPSFYEGFGLPILEAMSCGCPVITSREGSIPEIAGDAAFYVDAYDIKSIAQGTEKVFKDAVLQKELSKKGIAQSEKFSWKKVSAETTKIYQSLM